MLLIGSLNKSYESLGKALLYRKDSIAYKDVVATFPLDEHMSKDSNECKREASYNLYADTTNGNRGRGLLKGNESMSKIEVSY